MTSVCFTLSLHHSLLLFLHSRSAITEGDAGLEPVDPSVKSPKAGGAALGCVSTLLTVLRLLYGTYTEAPSAQPDDQKQQVQGQLQSVGKGGAAAVSRPPSRHVGMSGDCVADYRLALQKWVPREQERPR